MKQAGHGSGDFGVAEARVDMGMSKLLSTGDGEVERSLLQVVYVRCLLRKGSYR
jgi:hypothetical protein